MKNTGIEWTDHTVNFWWGCTKVSPACAHCYAESVAKVFGRSIFGSVPQWGAGKPRAERLEAARKEAMALDRKAGKGGTRPRVFVNSMSDWLDDEVSIEWLAYLLETIHLCPHLDFQLLTKRPENWKTRITACYMDHAQGSMEFDNWLFDWTGQDKSKTLNYIAPKPPPNVWIGTTVENQEMADKRIPALLRIPAKVRFLSCEPLLRAVDLDQWVDGISGDGSLKPLSGYVSGDGCYEPWQDNAHRVHWVIAGGESGGKARPSHPDWFRSLRDQCAAAGVPFFFKQWGEWCPATEEFGVTGHVMPDSGIMPCGKPAAWVGQNGAMQCPSSTGLDGAFAVARMGSKQTGRKLDGIEHSAFPA